MDSAIIEERPRKYMEQYLQKKEANGKWIEYWVVCRGNFLLFYSKKCETVELTESFRGSIELTPGSKCTIGKRKKYSFPFFLSTSKARYYFKSPTLLLRHQWIHAIGLSVMGAVPESPPKALPTPSPEPRKRSIDEETSSIDLNSNDSTQEFIIENTSIVSIESCDDDEENESSNVILVTSRPAGEQEITNFMSGERTPDASNYLVTDFLNMRNVDLANGIRKGIDNLSFEEEDSGPTSAVETKHFSHEESPRSGNSPNTANLYPKFSVSSPRMRMDSHIHNRAVRSAGSMRGVSSGLLSSSQGNSGLFLSVKPVNSNASFGSNRFSRHLVSSAPDLKAFTSDHT